MLPILASLCSGGPTYSPSSPTRDDTCLAGLQYGIHIVARHLFTLGKISRHILYQLLQHFSTLNGLLMLWIWRGQFGQLQRSFHLRIVYLLVMPRIIHWVIALKYLYQSTQVPKYIPSARHVTMVSCNLLPFQEYIHTYAYCHAIKISNKFDVFSWW